MRRLMPKLSIAPNTAAPTELPTMRMNMIDDVAIPRSFQPALAWVETRNAVLQKPMPVPIRREPAPAQRRHRVTGGGHPPPVPTERGVRISRTNALRKLVHSTASACSSEYGRRSLGGSNGVRSLIWLKASQVRWRPAQLRLHNIRRQ